MGAKTKVLCLYFCHVADYVYMQTIFIMTRWVCWICAKSPLSSSLMRIFHLMYLHDPIFGLLQAYARGLFFSFKLKNELNCALTTGITWSHNSYTEYCHYSGYTGIWFACKRSDCVPQWIIFYFDFIPLKHFVDEKCYSNKVWLINSVVSYCIESY